MKKLILPENRDFFFRENGADFFSQNLHQDPLINYIYYNFNNYGSNINITNQFYSSDFSPMAKYPKNMSFSPNKK